MLNTVVKARTAPRDRLNNLNIHLQVASNFASLQLRASGTGADDTPAPRGFFELPVDPLLGQDDPNLRVLRAMQVAAMAEIDRLRMGATAQLVHVPQPLDLSDIQRFPSSASR